MAGVRLIGVAAVSVGRALAAPGAAPWSVRTVDWLRSSGFGPLVDRIENWHYTRHAMANNSPDPSTLPSWPAARRCEPPTVWKSRSASGAQRMVDNADRTLRRPTIL